MVVDRVGKLSMLNEDYPFNYSNYGYAVLGLILEKVYGDNYAALVGRFVKELNLSHTQLSAQGGDLGRYWDWNEGDAYLSAGGLTSDINDMLIYAQAQLDGSGYFLNCHKELKKSMPPLNNIRRWESTWMRLAWLGSLTAKTALFGIMAVK